MNIVAVTACTTGIAQTYMAADVLESCAKNNGNTIKVETQGALGTLNSISESDIRSADIAILTNNIAIEGQDRFAEIRMIFAPIEDIIENPQEIMASLK